MSFADFNWLLTALLFCIDFSSAQFEGDAVATDQLVDDVVGESLFGNVKSEDLVNLLDERATFGSGAFVDESASKHPVQKQVVTLSTTSVSPLLVASQKLKKLDAWASQKAAVRALQAVQQAKKLQAAQQAKMMRKTTNAGAGAKALPSSPKVELGFAPVDLDDNDDVSSDIGKIFQPAPVPDIAGLVAKMAPPEDHPDVLAPAHHDLPAQFVNLPQEMLKVAREATVAPSPKPKLRKPIVVPKASLGSSLGEVVSDDSLTVAASASLKLDLPSLPAPNATAAAIMEANSLPQDLLPLGDLDSLNTTSAIVNRPNAYIKLPPVGRSRNVMHNLPVIALSLGPSLGETMPSVDAGLPERTKKSGTNGNAMTPASIVNPSDEAPDAPDSFLDEGLGESLQSPRQRSLERAKADASVLHALDSEVLKGAAASAADIDAAEAESEAGASDIVLPTVPLWGAPQSQGI